jgi:signal transduction histidine kinase
MGVIDYPAGIPKDKLADHSHDVSSRREQARTRQRTQDTDVALQHLRENYARLEELNALKTQFVAEISHELRTALHSLTMYIHLLEKGACERQEHYQSLLRQSIEHLTGFVEDTLQLSQLELHQGRNICPESLDLNALARRAVELHQARADAAGLELSLSCAEDLPLINGDVRMVQQLITNLLVNALKYTQRGYVHVATLRSGSDRNRVTLEVSDSGSGIPPQDLPHIFERFFRGRAGTETAIPGTGLGLAIVKEIVDLHGGQISVISLPGQGTTFRVDFPGSTR